MLLCEACLEPRVIFFFFSCFISSESFCALCGKIIFSTSSVLFTLQVFFWKIIALWSWYLFNLLVCQNPCLWISQCSQYWDLSTYTTDDEEVLLPERRAVPRFCHPHHDSSSFVTQQNKSFHGDKTERSLSDQFWVL